MPNWKEEVQEYTFKLSTQISSINKILSLNTDGLISTEMQQKLLHLKTKAQILQNKLLHNEFEVAIVGLEKSGKSTFANALMGNDILPSKDARCTYTSTSIRYGKDTACVKFFTWEEFSNRFQEKLAALKIPHAETLNFETLTLEQYKKVFEQLDENTKLLFGGTLNQDIEDILTYKETLKCFLGRDKKDFFGADNLSSIEFKKFIEDPQYALAVKEIIIETSRLANMQNAVIYDVPGFDSPTQMHKDQTIEKMKLADAVVLIVSAYKPSFTGPLVQIFRTESDYDGVRFGDKMFVFANMADKATTLSKNMDTIRNDLTKHGIMKSENILNRLMAGSARAKLENEGKVSGNESMTGLKMRDLDEDGIDLIREKLESYNQNERFEVLKTRIHKIQNDVAELFNDLLTQKNEMSTQYGMFASADLSTKLLLNSAKEIKGKLEQYRAELRKSFNDPLKPLTSKMVASVINNVTSADLGVTDEELAKAINRMDITTDMEIPIEIDYTLRKEKFRVIYRSFWEGVVKLAIEEHESCDSKIMDIFMSSLHVTSSNVYYEDLYKALGLYLNELGKGGVDYTGYYQSLVERFSVDLFEILLMLPYGDMSRWTKFRTEASNFYSLAMFDESFDPSITPDKQALHYLLLFHDQSLKERPKYLKEAAKLLEELICDSPDTKIAKLLLKLVKTEGSRTVEKLKIMFQKLDLSKPPEVKKETVFNYLESETDCISSSAIDDESLTKELYENYFNGKRVKTSVIIRDELNQDIDILHDTLLSAVVNAIKIEKPFLALEFQTIDNIFRSLDAEEYRSFLVQNIHMIAVEQYHDLQVQEQRRMAQAGILAEIKTILQEMKNERHTGASE